MNYLVTGGAGFIGSNIVRTLRSNGHDVLIVDHLTEKKVRNIAASGILNCMDPEDFFENLERNMMYIDGVFHQGACSDTMRAQYDPAEVVRVNTQYSIDLLDICVRKRIPIVYASSAAVYGQGLLRYNFVEDPANESPLNVYGLSKLIVDNNVRHWMRSTKGKDRATVVGLRYFNVYGPGEEHKGKMASVPYQMCLAKRQGKKFSMFEGSSLFRRDFVHVSDVVNVNLYFMSGPPRYGVFNVGTGQSRSFEDVVGICGVDTQAKDFPKEIRERYQKFTEAELTSLRSAGYDFTFLSLERGIDLSLQEWSFPNEDKEEG